jgi:CHAT domain-containing protein
VALVSLEPRGALEQFKPERTIETEVLARALIATLIQPDEPASETLTTQARQLIRVAAHAEAARVAEILKGEAERQLFIVPRRSIPLAAAIARLGTLAEQPALEALGAMTAADALREQGRYSEALRQYDRAGMLYLSVGDEVGWARTRLGSAYTRAATVDLGPALEEAERARGILRGHHLWVRLARLESAMGNLLRELGRTRDSLLAHARAAEAAAAVADAEERDLVGAEVRINRAAVYQRLDEYETAERLLNQAAGTFRRYGRPGPVAIADGNLARGLAAQGHVSRALSLATDVRQVMLSLGRQSHAAIFGRVAVECLLELNRSLEAAGLADAIVAELATHGAGVELAKSLLQRAVARERLGHYTDASHDLEQAATLFQTGGCEGWAAVARLQHAQDLERSGELLAALQETHSARRELRRRQLVVASAQADMLRARILEQLGDPSAALAAARAACAIARDHDVPLLEYQAWRVLGKLATDDGRALRAFSAAVNALEKSQGRILTEQRAGFLQLEDKLSVYASAIHLCLSAGKARRGFEFAERAKARALVDALALRSRGAATPASTPATRALAEELDRLRRRYDRLSSTLYEPMPLDELGGTTVAGHAEVVQGELKECQSRIGDVLDRMRLADVESVHQLAELQGKIHSPLRFIGPRTALVQYAVLDDDEIVIFVLRRGQSLVAVSAPPGAVREVSRLRRALELNIRTMTTRPGTALEVQVRPILERLYAILLRPVEAAIATCERLIVVPHGMLHGIPFAALRDADSYLIERYELALAPSASAIAFSRRPRANAAPRKSLVVAQSADGYLPGVIEEGSVVADLFDATQLFEGEATFENVREHLLDAGLVHLAAHGHSLPDAPLFSYLRLADGQLTALDCLGLTLDCDLVTLSACETGHAVVAAGDEPIGLTRSLLFAGARSVVQSLWRVDDRATCRLMADFYSRLRRGAGRAEALRAAQRTTLQTPGFSHPAFWAAFSIVGDWRPIQ